MLTIVQWTTPQKKIVSWFFSPVIKSSHFDSLDLNGQLFTEFKIWNEGNMSEEGLSVTATVLPSSDFAFYPKENITRTENRGEQIEIMLRSDMFRPGDTLVLRSFSSAGEIDTFKSYVTRKNIVYLEPVQPNIISIKGIDRIYPRPTINSVLDKRRINIQ